MTSPGSTSARSRATTKSSRSKACTGYVALLRGINVGGKNMLPMKDLVAMFADAGCADVRTYIQSGNVLFTADPKCATGLSKAVSKRIERRFGIRVPVILRSAQELQVAAANNPFLKCGADVSTLHVAFLADVPAPGRVAALDADRSPGDSFQVRGGEVYLHLPNGMARTKLTNVHFDSKLATISTARNWRTVLKLVELSQIVP